MSMDISKWIGWTQSIGGDFFQRLAGWKVLPGPWKINDMKPELRVFLRSGSTIIKHDVIPKDMYEKLCSLGRTDRIIFIAHGFLNTGDEPWIKDMKDAILRQEDATVIIVAWGGGANLLQLQYPQAASNTQAVGEWIASHAELIRVRRGRSVEIWGIGHSLGSHLIGAAGRKSKRFDRISGLDPAGPMFEEYNQDKRLSKDDAKIVDVIHTDGWYESMYLGANHYGTLIPLGTTDFYPNWGKEQPGTGNDNKSHFRAVELFIWSISNRGRFKTGQILASTPSFENIKQEKRMCAQIAEMGFYFDKGVIPSPGRCYYIETREKAPWI